MAASGSTSKLGNVLIGRASFALNFNSAINVIQYTSTNTEQFTYNMTGYNYPFLPMWLKSIVR